MTVDTFIGIFYGILIGSTVTKIIYMYAYRNYQPKPQQHNKDS